MGRAIESVLAQTRAADEILVVDDGSEDATAAVVRSFVPRVRYLYEENRGASEARNVGVGAVSSEWIAFLDSDDHWLPDHLRRIERAVTETGGSAALYFSDLRLPSEEGDGLLWETAGFVVDAPFELAVDATDWAMLPIQPMMLQASVFRRSEYLRLGGLRPELTCRHDTDLFLRICYRHPACAVAGCATQMTSAASRGNDRVTTVYGPATRSYWHETLVMYGDFVEHARSLPRRHRRALEARISHAHIRLTRFALADGDLTSAVRHAAAAAVADPRRFLQRLARAALKALRSRLSGRTRDARTGRRP